MSFCEGARGVSRKPPFADAASQKMETREYNGTEYEIHFTMPSSYYKANYALWYDAANGASRSIQTMTSEETTVLETVVENTIALY